MTNYMPGYRLHAAAKRAGQFDGSEALEAILASLPYIPQPERPKMKSARGNPLTPRGWFAFAGFLTLFAIAVVIVVL